MVWWPHMPLTYSRKLGTKYETMQIVDQVWKFLICVQIVYSKYIVLQKNRDWEMGINDDQLIYLNQIYIWIPSVWFVVVFIFVCHFKSVRKGRRVWENADPKAAPAVSTEWLPTQHKSSQT